MRFGFLCSFCCEVSFIQPNEFICLSRVSFFAATALSWVLIYAVFVFDLGNILVIWSKPLKILGRLREIFRSRVFGFDDGFNFGSRWVFESWFDISDFFHRWFVQLSWVSCAFEWVTIPEICFNEIHVFLLCAWCICYELQWYEVYMLWIFLILFFLSPVGVLNLYRTSSF